MSDAPSTPPPDLSSIDLSLSFAPAWAKESDSKEQLAKLAAKHSNEDRPERSGNRRGEWNNRSTRSERRPPQREGSNRSGDRPDRRNGKRHDRREEQRPERQDPQPLSGWEVLFLPDKHGVDGLAKQIKSIAKAYPLFELAQLVIEKSERYLVEFKRTSDTAPAIFQLKADGSLWLSEREAISHALSQQLDQFYRRERITVEPPKGVYTSVAQCGLSGVLLGPSNYHDYQTKLIKLHAERFASMPFEAFKSRVRMVRDDESIAKWKEEQSSKEVFYPLTDSLNAESMASEMPAPESAVETAEVSTAAESTAEDKTPVDTELPAEGDVPLTEAEEIISPKAEAAAESTPDTPAVQEQVPRLQIESPAHLERHFREHYAATAIVQIRQKVAAPGSVAMNSSSQSIHLLARRVWENLRRFPLPLAHILGQQLTARGLQIFKAHENITYVGVARPHHLDLAVTKVSETLSSMLEYIEAHPSVSRVEQWKALVALRTPTPETTEAQRETVVAADLFWLLREGHVIDYAKRGLEAARRPKPSPPRNEEKKKKKEGAATSPAAVAPLDESVGSGLDEPCISDASTQ